MTARVAYWRYALRCRAEGLRPFSRAAWELVREPLTERAMAEAWAYITKAAA